ncbi:hypothetical protein A2982_03680 [candidate division WWE3 bacterium RIFCSPLOWO2_01_FULL_39_13]|uniref:Metallo-beta-lactamase domain-containing protein n=1 Tax=candidate division WWE3 bacterium RIFCSPLOWO2_01_FULL_39_13 TaxID=1802624 RepID=A0A1F4V573_UNCKA|nr:MAG: hypothetical protein A2982_03680 [candidate division WWE3 bacterium RIFCSPLOWO2_01_FULL_39_13]
MNAPPLKIIPIGGTTTVQKNMYVYECQNDIIIMDCGIGFPDMETPGVDISIPDFSYVLENRDKVRGVVITHGHEDHRGSIAYLLKEYKFQVYAVTFVKKLIEQSLEEFTNLGNVKINTLDPNQPLQLGCFRLHPFAVNHSVPDTYGFAIDTPQGRIFHNTDFKFDWSPVMGKPFEIQKAAKLASEAPGEVLALLSDCLGSTTEGYSKSEKDIQTTFETILADSKKRQVFITTISSNISRIQQAINASVKYGRKVVLSGRSIRQTMEVAREMNYISSPDNVFVDERNSSKYNQSEITYIITGSYGQKNSGLWRVVAGEHKSIKLSENPVVIFSADPIPNSISTVNILIDELYIKNADVYYSEIQNNLHVSGHGIKGDLSLLANIVKPKYFIPIGGNIKHMRAYSDMMQEQGVEKNRILELLDGQAVIFENNTVKMGKKLRLKDVYVDGTLVGDVGTKVLDERMQMANHGMAVVVIEGSNVEVITHGFIFVKESGLLIDKTKKLVKESINVKVKGGDRKKYIEKTLQRFFFEETGRNPLVSVVFTGF